MFQHELKKYVEDYKRHLRVGHEIAGQLRDSRKRLGPRLERARAVITGACTEHAPSLEKFEDHSSDFPADLWFRNDSSGIGAIWDVWGHFAFLGKDDANLDRFGKALEGVANEIEAQWGAYQAIDGLSLLDGTKSKPFVRDDLDALCAAYYAALGKLSESLRAVPLPDLSDGVRALDAWRTYVTHLRRIHAADVSAAEKCRAELVAAHTNTLAIPAVPSFPAVEDVLKPELFAAQPGEDQAIARLHEERRELDAQLDGLRAELAAMEATPTTPSAQSPTTTKLLESAADQLRAALRAEESEADFASSSSVVTEAAGALQRAESEVAIADAELASASEGVELRRATLVAAQQRVNSALCDFESHRDSAVPFFRRPEWDRRLRERAFDKQQADHVLEEAATSMRAAQQSFDRTKRRVALAEAERIQRTGDVDRARERAETIRRERDQRVAASRQIAGSVFCSVLEARARLAAAERAHTAEVGRVNATVRAAKVRAQIETVLRERNVARGVVERRLDAVVRVSDGRRTAAFQAAAARRANFARDELKGILADIARRIPVSAGELALQLRRDSADSAMRDLARLRVEVANDPAVDELVYEDMRARIKEAVDFVDTVLNESRGAWTG